MKFKIFAVAAFTTAALVGTASASKADVNYTLSGIFDDGTPLTGTLSVNAYGYVDSLDLTTIDGTIPGYTYTGTTAFSDGGCPTANCIAYGRLSPAYLGLLELAFANPLGSVASDPIVGGEGGPSWENYSYSEGAPPIRYIASGVAAVVPESATWAMILLGFAGLGFARYRSRKAVAIAA